VRHLCLAIQPRVCFQNDSMSKLRYSGVASAYGWVTIVILSMVKREHPSYSNTTYQIICELVIRRRDVVEDPGCMTWLQNFFGIDSWKSTSQ
jgi:hypothetical protein